MKHIKPIVISILTIVIFTAALLIGMQSQWWQTEGRRTPLDQTGGGREAENSQEAEQPAEEDHVSISITGSSTVEDAINLGLTYEQLEEVLQGPLTQADNGTLIKDIVTQRGLQFGVIKDELNSLLGA